MESWGLAKGLPGELTTSTSGNADNYLLYVVQLERTIGEWTLVGGYSGENVTECLGGGQQISDSDLAGRYGRPRPWGKRRDGVDLRRSAEVLARRA